MRALWVWILTLGTVAAVAGAGWWFGRRPPAPDRPNVLLITLDTTRADHLRTFGYHRRTTPYLDQLARRSYVFANAWAPMATTLPSHTSLMTGAWPLEHGVLANIEHGGRRTLPTDGLVPIPELFRSAGWQTAAFVSATPLGPGTGIERGFEKFDLAPDKLVRKAWGTTDAACGWLRRHGDAPFLMWVHYYDPHGPYSPPDDYDQFSADARSRAWQAERGIPDTVVRNGGAEIDPVVANDKYDGELAYMDDEIGRILALLDRRGWADRTVVVVVGDHGEGLGQHGIAGHGQVWREQLQVPLLIYVPWDRGGLVDEPASIVDVVPTLLGWVDVPRRDAWLAAASGHDVLAGPSGPLFALTSLRQENLVGTPAQRALTAGDRRYIELGAAEHVYDLRTDPYEQRDLGAVLPFHKALLRRWARGVHDAQEARGRALGTGETVDVPADERAALEALGYIE